jgi:hypothetical protein
MGAPSSFPPVPTGSDLQEVSDQRRASEGLAVPSAHVELLVEIVSGPPIALTWQNLD